MTLKKSDHISVKSANKIANKNASLFAYPKGIISVGSDKLWKEGYHGEGMKVAVLDTGIMKHSDLNSRVVYRKSFEGSAIDSHGTHVAGTIAASADDGYGLYGVAPKCNLYDYQVLGTSGGKEINFLNAIKLAIKQDVDVINASLGTDEYNTYIEQGVVMAERNGIIIVAAGGNAGAGTYIYPSILKQTVSVANLNTITNRRHNSSATNKGIDIAAPGTDIVSCDENDGYTVFTGTSMATPHVTGILTLIMQKLENESSLLKTYRIKSRIEYKRKRAIMALSMLYANTVDIPPIGRDDKTGLGKLEYKSYMKMTIDHLASTSSYYIGSRLDYNSN